ncbi:MAG: hypothetical protein V3V16_00280 [Melioribacteraceae bacterium]
MLRKLKILGAGILLVLGFVLAIGYPDGGVKSVVEYTPANKNDIPTLNKKGNAKNFLSKKEIINEPVEKITSKVNHTKSVVRKVVNSHTVKSANIKPKAQTQKVKVVTPKPVKKKIKLVAPPPPPEEEEEDEGC